MFQGKIEATKARITELTQENTERLRQLTLLVGENKTLEKALDTRQTSLVSWNLVRMFKITPIFFPASNNFTSNIYYCGMCN